MHRTFRSDLDVFVEQLELSKHYDIYELVNTMCDHIARQKQQIETLHKVIENLKKEKDDGRSGSSTGSGRRGGGNK